MSDPLVEHVSCDNARDFLNTLRLSNERWGCMPGVGTHWVFRGHAESTWKLLPSALRADGMATLKNISMYRDLIVAEVPSHIDPFNASPKASKRHVSTLLDAIHYQWTAVAKFYLLADDVGHSIPGPIPSNPVEKWLRFPFDTSTSADPDPPISNPVFALAQHHGVPTRLLDWTKSPILAATFAANGAHGLPKNNSEIAVWALNVRALRTVHWPRSRTGKTGDRVVIMEFPKQSLDFLRIQDGCFTLDTRCGEHFLQHGVWPTLIDAVREVESAGVIEQGVFKKVTLPRVHVDELVGLLWNERTTLAHAMPTLDAVVRTLATLGSSTKAFHDRRIQDLAEGIAEP